MKDEITQPSINQTLFINKNTEMINKVNNEFTKIPIEFRDKGKSIIIFGVCDSGSSISLINKEMVKKELSNKDFINQNQKVNFKTVADNVLEAEIYSFPIKLKGDKEFT